MNYRALEDLIGILVKKAGFKLSDLKVEEDIDFLVDRKKYIEGEISTLKSKLDTFEYLDKDERAKDEEEKKYLDESLTVLNNNLSELDSKINEKNTKPNTRNRLLGEKDVLVKEITSVTEALELVNLKLQNKAYFDSNSKSKDEKALAVLEDELNEINASLDIKYKHPVILGNKLLEAFKDGKSFDTVSDEFSELLRIAKNEFDKTTSEVKDSNIFELMDRYTNKKRDVSVNLEKNDYNSENIKQDLFEKEKYHNSRLETFKATLDGIEKRKEELRVLIDESKKLYDNLHKDIQYKESRMNELVNVLYNEANLIIEEEEYVKVINDLRNEIVDDKYLENKYNNDIQGFKDEVKNLDINYTNINAEIASEERSLEIVHEKLNNKNNDIISRLQDKVNFLVYSNRVDNLVNEQQYLYVNVDVIRDEILSMWGKGDDSSNINGRVKGELITEEMIAPEVEEVEEPETTEEVIEEVSNESVYEEEPLMEDSEQLEVIDYLE